MQQQVVRLVEYHNDYLLWYTGCIHGPTFRRELEQAIRLTDGFQLIRLDFRWCALLFSVMTASITCSSYAKAQSWGFSSTQKRVLSKDWYKATISCLHLGEYTYKHHISSVQAIQVLSMSAHFLGFSHEQFPHFGAALRIAQSLGLHRLPHDPELDNLTSLTTELTEVRAETILRREVGRRLWSHMLVQDWLAIPSSGMYSVSKQHFTTIKPCRLDETTMTLSQDGNPMWVDYRNYLQDIASLMADFHDATTALTDPEAKYEQILSFDRKLRELNSQQEHRLFFTYGSDISVPQWLRWARRVALILHADRLIVMHRSFLGKSFTDSKYVYSRWASVAAAKAIVREVDVVSADGEHPSIWTNHGHLASASITLCLDIIHRSEGENEYVEHHKLLNKAFSLLGSYDESTLALRGIQMVSSLLKGKTITPVDPNARDTEHKRQLSEQGRFSWPLESRRAIHGIGAEDSANVNPLSPSSEATTAVDVHAANDPNSIHASMIPGDADVPNISLPHHRISSANVIDNFGTADINGVPPDVSWNELFSDYYSTQNGIENAFLVEDLFPNGTFMAW